jgi:hypothetical protein
MKASSLLGKADKLEACGRLPEARVALLEALAALEDLQDGVVGPFASSVRLPVVTALARIAATIKDRAEATRYARKGLALWSEFRLGVPNTRELETFNRWESWARAYLEWSSGEPVPPTMKLDFVASGEPYGLVIRLYGSDGKVVGALKLALESLSQGPIVLHAVPGIEALDGCHVTAVLVDRGRGLRRLGPNSFVWEENNLGWEQVIGLLEPFEFEESTETRFQFLSQGGDATMLISTDGRW